MTESESMYSLLTNEEGLATLPYGPDDPIQSNQDNRIGNTTATFRVLFRLWLEQQEEGYCLAECALPIALEIWASW